MIKNSNLSRYKERENFIEGQRVRVAEIENLGKRAKSEQGRFTRSGVVVKVCSSDSYIIREENGKLGKKRYYDLKVMTPDLTETLS